MKTILVKINNNDVEVPLDDIPSLVKNLIDAYHQQRTGEDSFEDYMTYDACMELLSEKFSDKMLRYHTGRLWGAICRLTMYGWLHFNTRCVICGESIDHATWSKGSTCVHATAIEGYHMILVSKLSIQTNFVAMTEKQYYQVGKSVKSDYAFIANALSE